jgi:hypothetical protein
MLVKVTNGVPEKYTIGKLRRDNPNTSFPRKIEAETLASFGVFHAIQNPRPIIDERTQKAALPDLPSYQNGEWVLDWVITNKTDDEVAAFDAEVAASVRAKRDQLLAECDWVSIRARELGDPIPIAWYEYRGDLRQIPDQEGFPHNVTWPTKPAG